MVRLLPEGTSTTKLTPFQFSKKSVILRKSVIFVAKFEVNLFQDNDKR